MDSTAGLADDIKQAFDNLNNSNVSYSTDAQSVQSGTTHGTHPHSPARTNVTPISLSPASCSNHLSKGSKGSSHQVQDVKLSAMEAIPQYNVPQQQQRQGEWQMLDQQQMLESAIQNNRQRSNPASDDDETEPSSSANTRENNTITFNNENNTSANSNTGATSTFGRLVNAAVKVSWIRLF